MIEISKHIEILLLSNDCVIVPGFGGFVAHHMDAVYEEKEHLFLPPRRALGFNPQLRLNDHLLVQSYIEAYDISYPEALRRIEDEVEEMRQHLGSKGEYEMDGLGLMQVNEHGNIVFTPYEAGILSPELYGLSSYEMLDLKTLSEIAETAEEAPEATENEVVSEAEDNTSEEKSSEAIVVRMSWIRNAVAVAAAILAFFFVGAPISNDVPEAIQQSSVLPVIAQSADSSENASRLAACDSLKADSAKVECKQTEATSEQASAEEQPIAQESAATQEPAVKQEESIKQEKAEESKTFFIILASQTLRNLAEAFIDDMSKTGYDQLHIMEMENTSKVRVAYSSYQTYNEAMNELRKLRSKNDKFEDAWILKVK